MIHVLVMAALCIAAFAYIKIAKYYNIVDKPNHRSSHTEPVIRGAGVIFYLALLMFFGFSNFAFPLFFIGVSSIAIVSYIDDLVSLSSQKRLVFQFLAIALALYQLMLITDLHWAVTPLLLIIGVGFINMFNFMDGINGITGIYSLVALGGLYILNAWNNIIDARLLEFLIIAVLIFGFFNFRKRARFFCGDVGSITLAFVFFFLIVLFSIQLSSPLIVLLMSVYLTDAVLTIIYRKTLNENLTEAHRHHLYQKLTDVKNVHHLKTSVIYGALQGLIVVVILVGYQQSLFLQCLIFIIVTVGLAAVYYIVFKRLLKAERTKK